MRCYRLNNNIINNAATNHDIKTLVNGVLCMSSLLEATPLSIEQAEIIHLLRKSAEELEAVMTKALNGSQSKANQFNNEMKPFKLSEVIEIAFDTFKLTIQDKPIETNLIVEGKVPSTIKGDKSALSRILINLLNNAGKFTQKGKIELHVSVKTKPNHQAIITFRVSDTGIGIEKENFVKIFKHFTKFNSDGYGLGLATAKELVEQNGGMINVESTVGHGTNFTFSLPFEVTSHNHTAHKVAPNQNPSLKNVNILIADDDDVYVKYLGTILNHYKANLTIVSDSKGAIEAAHNKRFDIIMLDLHLPDKDGYETAFNIRNTNNINRNTPVVGMTADKSEHKKMAISQMNDVLPKPLNAENLVAKLHKALYMTDKKSDIHKITFDGGSTKPHRYSPMLNKKLLTNLYGDDLEHASLMFKTFLTESLKEWYEILRIEQEGDFVTIKNKIHRLKPAFLMVGMSNIENMLAQLEANFFQYSPAEISKMLKKISTEIDMLIPIVESELNKMELTNTIAAA